MRINEAVNLIVAALDSWVRIEQVSRVPGGLNLSLSAYKGRRGKRIDQWVIACRGVREVHLTDFDGGGLAVYSRTHPAARQYVARKAVLRWPRGGDEDQVRAALQRAHVDLVQDWIPFDRYLEINTPWNGTSVIPHFAPAQGKMFVCRGPEFLLRAYAEALATVTNGVRLTVGAKAGRKGANPQVLHSGESYIVAEKFGAHRDPAFGGDFWLRADALRKSARKQRSESAALLREMRDAR